MTNANLFFNFEKDKIDNNKTCKILKAIFGNKIEDSDIKFLEKKNKSKKSYIEIEIKTNVSHKNIFGKMTYKLSQKDNCLKLFDKKFYKNNNHKCRMILKNKEYKLKNTMIFEEEEEKEIKVKIKSFEKKLNSNSMFKNCISLTSFTGNSKTNFCFYEDMGDMFYNCSSLISLSSINNWEINNVKKMKNFFRGCSSIKHMSDISKWDTSNVTDMSYMFSLALFSLKNTNDNLLAYNTLNKLTSEYDKYIKSSDNDISRFDLKKIETKKFTFKIGLPNLSIISDISKWNVGKVSDMSYMFYGCSYLICFQIAHH
jgi:surface protein